MKTKLSICAAILFANALNASESCLTLAISTGGESVCLIAQQCDTYAYCVRTYVGSYTNQHCMMLTTDQARTYSNCIVAGPFTGVNGIPACNIACSQMLTNIASSARAMPDSIDPAALPVHINLLTSTNLTTWTVAGNFAIDESAFEWVAVNPEQHAGATEIYGQRLATFPLLNHGAFYRTQETP